MVTGSLTLVQKGLLTRSFIIDPKTQKAYVLVERDKRDREIAAQHLQDDREAIAEGIAQMEAGQGKPLEQAMSDMRSRLGFPIV